jgi:hypothetical protein
MRHDLLIVLAFIPLLGACGGSGGKVASASAAKPVPAPRKPYLGAVRPPVPAKPPTAQVLAIPGLEGVIGASASDLLRQFGPSRLDVQEGDARKLQFSAAPCVLDVYLYPATSGGEPRATYVEARRASDGKEVDRAQCVMALRPAAAPAGVTRN